MFVIIEYVNGIFKKLPSDSSDSITHQLLFPNFAEFPKELSMPPFIIVGSNLAWVKILEINEVDVVFPWDPVTTTLKIDQKILDFGRKADYQKSESGIILASIWI